LSKDLEELIALINCKHFKISTGRIHQIYQNSKHLRSNQILQCDPCLLSYHNKNKHLKCGGQFSSTYHKHICLAEDFLAAPLHQNYHTLHHTRWRILAHQWQACEVNVQDVKLQEKKVH